MWTWDFYRHCEYELDDWWTAKLETGSIVYGYAEQFDALAEDQDETRN